MNGVLIQGCSPGIHSGTNSLINDIFLYVLGKVRNSYNYEYDNILQNTHQSIADLKYNLETNSMAAIHWFDTNGLKSNQAKSQAMIINNHSNVSVISLNAIDINIPLKHCVNLLAFL